MAKFTVEHPSSIAPEQTYQKIKEFLSKDNEMKKFDANAKCSFDDSSKSALIKGSQFKAEMKVEESGSGAKVAILVDLPFLLMPFKGKIEESLKKMLSKHLA